MRADGRSAVKQELILLISNDENWDGSMFYMLTEINDDIRYDWKAQNADKIDDQEMSQMSRNFTFIIFENNIYTFCIHFIIHN